MGWGTFYEVSDSARVLLSDCRSKADWYKALGTLGLESAPQLDAEDSIRFWASKFQSIGDPAERFFQGDCHAEYDSFGDPNASFVGNETVRWFLARLEMLGKDFFIRAFPHTGPYGTGDSWLYDPLLGFLRGVCS